MTNRMQVWSHLVTTVKPSLIYPDGCRDVLVLRMPGRPVEARLTPFDLAPRRSALPVGTAVMGLRLAPGALVSPAVLARVAQRPDEARAIVDSDMTLAPDAGQAIRALSAQPGSTAAGVARDLGVSLRSLQRLFAGLGLPPPDVWRQLARARRAAQQLGTAAPLADIAHDCGFSDQAHMTREMRRWFGKPPQHLRRDADALAVLGQPALGNWTGEQISISTPSGSLT